MTRMTFDKNGDLKCVHQDAIEKLFNIPFHVKEEGKPTYTKDVRGQKLTHNGKEYKISGYLGDWIVVQKQGEK